MIQLKHHFPQPIASYSNKRHYAISLLQYSTILTVYSLITLKIWSESKDLALCHQTMSPWEKFAHETKIMFQLYTASVIILAKISLFQKIWHEAAC